ncbi:N-6 DNA methylase [Paenibacillus sp. FSL R7-269]|uniref:HsdM family class I SAM-dependent methyltransferase n=1 Tax=Paenibacillus sp. FSL R7-269 TaxID=1226755 RepID=UPI0003E23149|nr:N-6 DNA methylase [Paenibacillus sp. FSL R7-269]ETT56790.1 N-6 DNA methylase [Paenibacillus sp. FSL R7-269]
MANERITEDIVRDHFKNDPLFTSIKFEEQKSSNIRVAECLATASKSLTGNAGMPEFIITFPSQSMEYVIIIECKYETIKHESKDRNIPKNYAVDGAIHYSNFLSKEFNVISIAVSGDNETGLQITQFIQHKNSKVITEFKDNKLLSIFDYVKTFKNEQFAYNLKDINIIEKAVKLNVDFQACSISEGMRNTLVSAILLALQNDVFKASYPISESSQDIADLLITAVEKVLKKAKVRRIEDMLGVYRGIYNEPLVRQKTLKQKKKSILSVEFFKETIKYLETQVYPLLSYEDSGYDILGRFYTEFIRYAASKQKQGLVLTPSHITDLFCDLADLKVNDIVYDPCCGTGGFLIAAMKRMLSLAGNDSITKDNIKKNQLIGIELRSEMFTFACSNMMLRGDGKSNIDCGDCFDDSKVKTIREKKPTVSFLNPPYDLGPADQMRFVEKALEVVAPQNGRVVAIVQMSCAVQDEKELKAVKKRLLNNYTLKAVISMPDEVFYPVGVITCIMVFDAFKSNSSYKSWFGYLKDDGFVKRKNKGRIDVFDRWKEVRKRFKDAYINSEEIVGFSVKQHVEYDDEWCAEAYMETDYSTLNAKDFENILKRYATFKKVGITVEVVDEDES